MRAYWKRPARLLFGTAFASVIALAVGMRPAAAATTSADYEFDFVRSTKAQPRIA
jgi:hypothetical protein